MESNTIWHRYREQSVRTTVLIRILSQIAEDCKSVHLSLSKLIERLNKFTPVFYLSPALTK